MSAFDSKQMQQTPMELESALASSKTSRQSELLDWFTRAAPSVAPAYEGAVAVLSCPGFPGKVHFVSHVVRDIYNKLPEILDGSVKRINSGEVYRSLIEKIVPHWPRSPELMAGNKEMKGCEEDTDSVRISRFAFDHVAKLLEKLKEVDSQPSTAEHLTRVLFEHNPTLDVRVPRRLVDLFNAERKWFVSRAHLSSHTHEHSDEELAQHFDAFEMGLLSFVGQYFAGTRELDVILQQANERTG